MEQRTPSTQAGSEHRRLWFASFGGVVAAALYGGALYLMARLHLLSEGFVTASYLFGSPFVVGAICVLLSSPAQQARMVYRCLAPWLPLALLYVIAALIQWETLICLVMLAPLLGALSTVGGALAGWGAHHWRLRRRVKHGVVGCMALLPLLAAHYEARIPTPEVVSTVEDEVVIQAPPAVVWSALLDVPDIRRDELRWSFSHFIGLPRPQAALMTGEGVGAVRDLYWEQGVHFREHVTQWEPAQTLGYRVDVSPARESLRRLDTHVVIGDQYFDILRGQYRLQDLGDGRTRLTLSSTYRMRTMVNGYGQWWADRTLDDFHTVVLDLIRQRVENAPAAKG